MSSPLERLSKWLQLKVYQIEVTFSVYMFTPLEKLAFCTLPLPSLPLRPHTFPPPRPLCSPSHPRPLPCFPAPLSPLAPPLNSHLTTPGSILFLLSSLTFLACVLYLPQHIIFITERAWFYINGENVDVAQVVKEAVVSATHAAIEHATETAAAVGQTGGLVREL